MPREFKYYVEIVIGTTLTFLTATSWANLINEATKKYHQDRTLIRFMICLIITLFSIIVLWIFFRNKKKKSAFDKAQKKAKHKRKNESDDANRSDSNENHNENDSSSSSSDSEDDQENYAKQHTEPQYGNPYSRKIK